jgi:hypothetical protein
VHGGVGIDSTARAQSGLGTGRAWEYGSGQQGGGLQMTARGERGRAGARGGWEEACAGVWAVPARGRPDYDRQTWGKGAGLPSGDMGLRACFWHSEGNGACSMSLRFVTLGDCAVG